MITIPVLYMYVKFVSFLLTFYNSHILQTSIKFNS